AGEPVLRAQPGVQVAKRALVAADAIGRALLADRRQRSARALVRDPGAAETVGALAVERAQLPCPLERGALVGDLVAVCAAHAAERRARLAERRRFARRRSIADAQPELTRVA